MANIKVAVRLRPLNNREDANEKLCVDIREKTVVVTDFRVPFGQDCDHRQRVHRFSYDYCYWSVDLNSPRYAGQCQICDQLGKDILRIILDGYNCCLFTYGQRGSGKTYTMLGNSENPGLIPLLCQEIFQSECQANRLTFRIELSCMDIYNEKVYDLIQPSSDIKSLRIREHPLHGPYIDGLSHQVVKDVDSMTSLIGQIIERRNKSITQSRKNRSHTIFTIRCNQILLDEKGVREINSKLHLVDLAASERPNAQSDQNSICATSNINKSLTTLGIVITSLANRESKFVPYRDSVLTWLLKDSLGGNSFTFMLATVSPSSTCCSETINTLRYAQRVKSIINRPVVNQTPAKHLLDHLKCEVDHLKEILLHSKSIQDTGETASIEKVHSIQDSLENMEKTECDTGTTSHDDPPENNLSKKEEMPETNSSLSPNVPGPLTSKYLVTLKDKINSKQEGNYIYQRIPAGCRRPKCITSKKYSRSDTDISKLGLSPNFKLFQAAICGLSNRTFNWEDSGDNKVKVEFRSCTEVNCPVKNVLNKNKDSFSVDSLKNKCEVSSSDSSLDYSKDSLVSLVKKDDEAELGASTESFTFVFLPKKACLDDDSTSPRTLSIDSVYAELLGQLEIDRNNKDAATQTVQKSVSSLSNLNENLKSKHQLIQLMSDVVSLLKSGHKDCFCNRIRSKSHLRNLIEFRKQMVASTQIKNQNCRIVSRGMISCFSSGSSTESFASKIENIQNSKEIHQKWRSDSGAVCPSNVSSERLTSPEIINHTQDITEVRPINGKEMKLSEKEERFSRVHSSELEFHDESIFPQDVFMRLPSRFTNNLAYLLYRRKLGYLN